MFNNPSFTIYPFIQNSARLQNCEQLLFVYEMVLYGITKEMTVNAYCIKKRSTYVEMQFS